MIDLKVKPEHEDFNNMPVVDFTGKLDNPVMYNNTFNELIVAMQNPVYVRIMDDAPIREIFDRAYNHAQELFASYNRRAYICLKYADEVRKRVQEFVNLK